MAPPKLQPAPAVDLPAGTALKIDQNTPTLFTPIKIRGLELQNRFVVSPMGTWSAYDGHLTDFHLVHLGGFAFRGAALTIVESTSVTANGRSSPQDSGLWKDSQIAPLKRIADYIHAVGQKLGIQLNHTGFKAGMLAPRLAPTETPTIASVDDGGWPDDVWAPSAIPHTDAHVMPKALSREGIEMLVEDFGNAARRAVVAGVDFVEIHGAHGYLIHQFLSPLTNQRTDEYGGTFENRVRFVLQVIRAVRKELPDSIPLCFRISATEWMEWSGQESWDIDQSTRLAKLLPAAGVDMLDVSSGGHQHQKIKIHPRYQIDLAKSIHHSLQKEGVPLLVAAVGFINSPEIARRAVQAVGSERARGATETLGEASERPLAHLAFVGRQFAREPEFVLRTAQELGVEVNWPYQYEPSRAKVA